MSTIFRNRCDLETELVEPLPASHNGYPSNSICGRLRRLHVLRPFRTNLKRHLRAIGVFVDWITVL